MHTSFVQPVHEKFTKAFGTGWVGMCNDEIYIIALRFASAISVCRTMLVFPKWKRSPRTEEALARQQLCSCNPSLEFPAHA